MSDILTVVQQKLILQQNQDIESKISLQGTSMRGTLVMNLQKSESVKIQVDENYYSVFDDSFSLYNNSNNIQENENYESFDNNVLLDIREKPMQYQLEKSIADKNYYIESTRFFGDIIFILNHTRIFEASALVLSASIIASLFLLPDGFNLSISLLFSAPLAISISGLYMKYIKKKT